MIRNSCGYGSMKLMMVNMICLWILERRLGKILYLVNSLMIFFYDFVIFRVVKFFDKDI